MDPGCVPDELKNLSYVQLITLIRPAISIFKLKGGQFCCSGHEINQDLQLYL